MHKRDRPLFLALIAVVAALCFNVIAARQCSLVYGYPEGPAYQSETNHHQPSGTAAIQATTEDQDKPGENGCFRGPFGIPADGWVALFTLVLTVATLLLWIVTDQALSHARDSSERQFRAYVYVRKATAQINNGAVTIQIYLRNGSPTPAYEVDGAIVVWLDTFPAPSATPQRDKRPLSADMGPGGKLSLWRRTSLSDEELRCLQTREQILWCQGKVVYRDAFKNPRFVTFRYYLNPLTLQKALEGKVRMSLGDEGNRSD